MKRIVSLLLAVLMLIPLLASCGNRRLTIIKDGKCTVLYDPNTVSTGDLKRLTVAIEETTGIAVDPVTSGTVEKGWILVGNVEVDGKRVSAELRSQDCFAGIAENYYLIGGTNQRMVADAITHFIDNVLPFAKKGGKKLTVAAADNYSVESTYRVEGLSIGGEGLGQFTIVVPEKASLTEYRTAVLLQQHILQAAGYSLPVLTEEEVVKDAPRICVGKSLSPHTVSGHGYAIGVEGKAMYICAESFLGYEAAQTALSEKVFHAKNTTPQMDDAFALTGDGADRATAPLTPDGDVRVVFSNIHGYDQNNGQTPVKEASQQLAELFLTYLPDVLGTQEFSPNSYSVGLDTMLSSEYEAINVSTGGDYKTYTALFYRKSSMELLKCGYLGFNSLTYNEYPELLGSCTGAQIKHHNTRQSDGKSVTSNGRDDNSKGVTWGIFRVKATGKLLMVGSTHLWWENNDKPQDEIARKVQIMALREHLSENATAFMTEKGLSGTLPILVGGDYNTALSRDNCALSVMERAGNTFCNVNTKATVKLTVTTHHGYATFNHELGIYEDPQYSTGKANDAIDHIYINNASTGWVKVNRIGILSDLYAHLSSDHNPIYTDISLLDSAPRLTT